MLWASVYLTEGSDIVHEMKTSATVDIPRYDERRRPRRDAPAADQSLIDL
jgi:hypothetical protein